MRSALQKLLAAAYPRKAVINLFAPLLRQWKLPRPAAQLLHIETKSLGRRNPSRRSMRLIEKPGLAQRSHYIPYRCRAHAVLIGKSARNGLRRYRLTRRDVSLDNCGQYQPLTRADPQFGSHHFLGMRPSAILVAG